MNWKNKLDFVTMMNDLVACPERNRDIVVQLVDCINSGDQTLVLSTRRNHLGNLSDLLKDSIDKNPTIGFILGGGKKKEQIEAKKCQLIFSTFNMGSEALDIPTLSRVVFCAPVPNVVQCVARILRSKNPGARPLVIDILDCKSIWYKFWNQRKKFYIAEGFEIEYYTDGGNNNNNTNNNAIDFDNTNEDAQKQQCTNELSQSIDFSGELEEESGQKFKRKRKASEKSDERISKKKKCPF